MTHLVLDEDAGGPERESGTRWPTHSEQMQQRRRVKGSRCRAMVTTVLALLPEMVSKGAEAGDSTVNSRAPGQTVGDG